MKIRGTASPNFTEDNKHWKLTWSWTIVGPYIPIFLSLFVIITVSFTRRHARPNHFLFFNFRNRLSFKLVSKPQEVSSQSNAVKAWVACNLNELCCQSEHGSLLATLRGQKVTFLKEYKAKFANENDRFSYKNALRCNSKSYERLYKSLK